MVCLAEFLPAGRQGTHNLQLPPSLMVPSAGIEPASSASEADGLSIGLRGHDGKELQAQQRDGITSAFFSVDYGYSQYTTVL